MTEAVKQDSNFTELRYAVEDSPGVLPGSPVWLPLEPNDYKDFGGEVKTKARQPINASRQRKKGVVVDLDAKAGFTQDVTPDNIQDIMQSFLYANIRKKDELASTAAVGSATDAYTVASGGLGYEGNDLLLAKQFDTNANNGLKKVVEAGTGATAVKVSTDLTDESGAEGTISRVGYEFGSGVASINATASEFPKLEVAAPVAATDTLTLTGNAVAADTVTINGRVYTFRAAVTTIADEVKVGADAGASIDNLVAAINLAAGGGTTYGSLTTVNADVSAVNGAGDTLVVTAKVKGTIGNRITTAESVTGTWASVNLTGGTGRDLRTLDIISGEPVYIGGDGTGESFATAANNGYTRVREVAEAYIKFDKTQDEMVDDAGTSKTVRIFFGRVLKNENSRSLIIKRPIQLERTLGAPDDAQPDQVQAEYVTRCYGDEATVDMKTADIVTLYMSFLGGTTETVDGTNVPQKSGSRPSIEEADAFNSTSDVSLIKMALVTDGEAFPDPLFAFLTDFSLKIKNNLKQNKAVSVLGAFDITPGMFEVSADVNAYFTKVAGLEAVKNNADVTIEVHMAKNNQGISIDLPLVSLGKALADVKADEAIMLPMTADAATGKKIYPDLDHTMFVTFWDYLPNSAE